MIQYLESIERMFPILIGGYILFKRNFSYLMRFPSSLPSEIVYLKHRQ